MLESVEIECIFREHSLCTIQIQFRYNLKDNPAKWKEVEELMDHWDERGKDDSIVKGLNIIFTFFTKKLCLDWIMLEDVYHVFGVLQTNCVSLVSLQGRACFPTVSLLSHSCVPNLEPVRYKL